MEEVKFLIEYDDFKGPANVLLELIRKRKVDIYKIRISVIITDFLEFIDRSSKNIILDTLSSFLYIASIMLELKSRSIIPSQQKDEIDDEEAPSDMSLLAERERQLRVFQKVSSYIEHLKEIEELYFVRDTPIESEFIDIYPDIFNNLNIGYLSSIAMELLKKTDFDIDLSKIHLDGASITIIDEMNRISDIVIERKEINFKELSGKYALLIDKIICFLSILELYKNEIIDIIQFENFGDILIKNK